MDTPENPIVVIVPRYSPRRKQSMASEIYAMASTFVIVGLLCFGVILGVTTGKAATTSTPARKTPTVKRLTPPARPVAQRGAGKQRSPIRTVTHVEPATGGRVREATAAADRRNGAVERANALVLESLKAARQGLFTKANDLAQEARSICPSHPVATGAWYIAAYAEQYTDLADEALSRLNGANDDIDFGPRYGRAAFIERKDDAFTFRCKGDNKTFTAAQLNAMDGVRFRITRQFLDNGDMPANDLILAAVHHLKNIDESGNDSQSNPDRSLEAAQARCRSAAGRGGDVSEHASHLLALFGWLQTRSDSDTVRPTSVTDAPSPRSNAVAAR